MKLYSPPSGDELLIPLLREMNSVSPLLWEMNPFITLLREMNPFIPLLREKTLLSPSSFRRCTLPLLSCTAALSLLLFLFPFSSLRFPPWSCLDSSLLQHLTRCGTIFPWPSNASREFSSLQKISSFPLLILFLRSRELPVSRSVSFFPRLYFRSFPRFDLFSFPRDSTLSRTPRRFSRSPRGRGTDDFQVMQ